MPRPGAPRRLAILAAALAALASAGWAHAAAGGTPAQFTSTDGVRLAGTLTLPEGRPPFPGVVLVHGSGRTTREMMAWLAHGFLSRGFAVLAYDKRGVGESGGAYSGVGVGNSTGMLLLLARDAAAGLDWLLARPEVDPRRAGFAGVSQAGWIIPPALGLSPHARFAVIVSGPTVPVGEEMRYSELVEDGTASVAEGHKDLESFKGPAGFDPEPYVRAMTAEALWLYGDDDRSIPALRCLPIFDELRKAGRTNHKVKVYPGQGHSLDGSIWADVDAWLRKAAILPGG